LELIAGEESIYGYRKLTVCLRRQYNLIINKKKVYRLCKELDILSPQRRKKVKYPRKLAINHKITGSNQLWEIDIKYIYINDEDRFIYLMSLIDVFDRAIIDYHLGLSCKGNDASYLIQKCLWRRKLLSIKQKPIIRTDNGPQFICNTFETTCDNYKIKHERIPPKTPDKIAHIESFHATLKRDCLGRHIIGTYQEGYKIISDYIDFYNHRRIHGSLNDQSPEIYYQMHISGNLSGKEVCL